MTEPTSARDIALLQELHRVAALADPVPSVVVELSQALFCLRDLDAELALLVEDAYAAAAAVRAEDDGTRLLSFEASSCVIEVQVTLTPGRVTLLGQLVPAPDSGVRVRLDSLDGPLGTARVDDLGGFRFEAISARRLRLHVELEAGAQVETPWFDV